MKAGTFKRLSERLDDLELIISHLQKSISDLTTDLTKVISREAVDAEPIIDTKVKIRKIKSNDPILKIEIDKIKKVMDDEEELIEDVPIVKTKSRGRPKKVVKDVDTVTIEGAI